MPQDIFRQNVFFQTHPTTNNSVQNGSSVGRCAQCTHVFARFAPICTLSPCLSTKFLHRRSVGSLLRVRCWLGTCSSCEFINCSGKHLFFCPFFISSTVEKETKNCQLCDEKSRLAFLPFPSFLSPFFLLAKSIPAVHLSSCWLTFASTSFLLLLLLLCKVIQSSLDNWTSFPQLKRVSP